LSEIFIGSKDKLDLDKDGLISKAELEAAKVNKQLSPAELKMSAILSEHYKFVMQPNGIVNERAGIRVEDVGALDRAIKNGPRDSASSIIIDHSVTLGQA